jgi:tetratricopeptide (TPR) repeat protein
MTVLFDGLYIYELAFFILGCVLCCAFLYQVMNNREYKNLLMFFFLPVIMIGYPSVKKIQYDNLVIDLEQNVQSASAKPVDSNNRKEVVEKINALQDRSEKSARGMTVIARTIVFLGDTAKALKLADSAVKLDPQNKIAFNFHELLQDTIVSRISRATKQLSDENNDSTANVFIKNNLFILSRHTEENPYNYLVIARAYKALGDHENSSLYADSVLKFQPGSKEAIQMKKQMVVIHH